MADEKNTNNKKTAAASAVGNVKMPEVSKQSISEFFRKYLRVLKLARRPTKEEFFKISAVAAAGIAVIGVLGFIIYLIFHYLLP
ncbi:Protein translocase subunit SecE [Methanocorpusculaceae archaeon Ag1]|uniref:Protein translocase subunit SecE n=1 Tax=Methanorbis furvi TaxID=3028299 RepID=A0AAE4MDG4_9EURY|nr:Protein translocase subunit SecE [Methanocorpusculaceae archaeon Ag1]